MNAQRRRAAGFTLLPVILVMTLIAGVAYLLNRDNGLNAAMVASQGDRDRARYAAEAGLQAVNADIQTRNCTGLYPSILSQKINSNFAGASYSAYAVVPFGNVVDLVATGVYNGTSVTLTRSNVIAYQSAPQSDTLQPNAAAGFDTYIEINNARNYGASTVMWGFPNYDFPMIRFDLSMFPPGSLPLASTISLYQSSGSAGSGSVALHRLSNAWTEGTTTFNPADGANWTTSDGNAPWPASGYYHPVAVASIPYVSGSNTWVNLDVTALATGWLLGRYPNYGVINLLSGGVGSVKYQSSDSATSSQRPKMSFFYLLPCGATGPSGPPPASDTVTLGSVADDYIRGGASTNYGAAVELKSGRDNGGPLFYSLLKFDLSSVPVGTLLTSARLRLYQSASRKSGSIDIGVHRVDQDWSENGANWATSDGSIPWSGGMGGTYTTPAVATIPVTVGSFDWYEWDVTPLVQEWVDGASPNYGIELVFVSANAGTNVSFSSREAGANTPQLIISY